MSIEKQRARLMRKVIALELIQDVLYLGCGIFTAVRDFFQNTANTAKMMEVDAAKQYRDLVGSAVREVDQSLLGAATPVAEEDD